MSREDVVDAVIRLVRPALAAAGFALVDVEYVRSGGAWVLRFFIDRSGDEAGGVTLDDCQRASQLLDPLLDTADVIQGTYLLEVSSPGVNRRVRWAADFARFAGEAVQLQFASPLEGRRKLRGTLRGITDDDEVLVEAMDGRVWHVPRHAVKRATLQRL